MWLFIPVFGVDAAGNVLDSAINMPGFAASLVTPVQGLITPFPGIQRSGFKGCSLIGKSDGGLVGPGVIGS